jgi:hypothetical protein
MEPLVYVIVLNYNGGKCEMVASASGPSLFRITIMAAKVFHD